MITESLQTCQLSLGVYLFTPHIKPNIPSHLMTNFSDTTPFTHNVTVSLGFPTIISLATARFFRKCFATSQAGHTVILIGGFRDKPSNRKIRSRLSRISSAAHHHAHILLTFPSNTFPAGTVRGWPESPDDDHRQHNRFSLHERFGVPTQPVKMDPHMANRHISLATHPCNTRVIFFTPQPTTRVNSVPPSSAHRLSSILQGSLVPNKTRGDRYALLWRQWSSDSTQLRYIDIPTSSALDPLMCIRDCIWEQDEGTLPSPPPPDNDNSNIANARRALLAIRDGPSFPKHITPHEFVVYLRERTHTSVIRASMAAVVVVRADRGGQFILERAKSSRMACALRLIGFQTQQSAQSIRTFGNKIFTRVRGVVVLIGGACVRPRRLWLSFQTPAD